MATETQEKPARPLLGGEAVEIGPDGQIALIGGRCADCGSLAFPAPPVCAGCMGETIRAEILPRTGTLYTFSKVHVAPRKWNLPMTVGYVDLDNGVRLFTHLEGEDFCIGDTVEVGLGTIGADERGPIEGFVFRRVRA